MSVHIANQIIKKEWTDYNNHMNMAYYVLVFDQIWEIILEKFKMGEQSAKTTKMSTMVVETHTTYMWCVSLQPLYSFLLFSQTVHPF